MNYTLRIRVYVLREELPDYPDPFLFISEWDWNPTNFNEPSRGIWIGDFLIQGSAPQKPREVQRSPLINTVDGRNLVNHLGCLKPW